MISYKPSLVVMTRPGCEKGGETGEGGWFALGYLGGQIARRARGKGGGRASGSRGAAAAAGAGQRTRSRAVQQLEMEEGECYVIEELSCCGCCWFGRPVCLA